MSLDLFSDESDLHAEVDRRLRALRERPDELLHHFDSNGDGVLDASEWSAVRRVLADRVRAETRHEEAPELENEVIDGRYELLSELGHGAQGKTHLARDLQNDRLVAIKLLDVAGVDEWKHFELLQREAKVLADLQHKRIPELYNSFETDVDGKPGIAVVQEYISGDNLEFRLAAGELFDERKLLRIAEDVLVILSYLHRLDPPVIHRDVKPANIIVNENREVALVDFGAVQIEGTAQDTVIGTSGYMPPEQLMSRPTRASDVYSLGATLVHLATRKHPGELESERMKLKWRHYANLSDGLMDLIDHMLEPALEDRFSSTVEALEALESVRMHGQMARLPSSTGPGRAIVVRENDLPAEAGRVVYGGKKMTIREHENILSVSLPTTDLYVGKMLTFALPAGVGFVAAEFSTLTPIMVVILVLVAAIPGLAILINRWAKSNARRTIEFVASDQLIVREDGVIKDRRRWISNPRVFYQGGRYPTIILESGSTKKIVTRAVHNEERDMVEHVNRFLIKHSSRYHETDRTLKELRQAGQSQRAPAPLTPKVEG